MLCCADISCKLAVLGSGSWSKINLLHSEDSFVSWWWSLKKIQQWKCGYLLYTYEWLDRIWLTSSKHRFPKQWILPVDKPKPHLVPCEVGTDSTFDNRSVLCYKVALHSIPENKEGQLTCTGHHLCNLWITALTTGINYTHNHLCNYFACCAILELLALERILQPGRFTCPTEWCNVCFQRWEL